MVYTVTQLATLSKVSVRTLHWYDELGLLKPAYYGSNGYRYYAEKELLHLQQILFFRELGFELMQIKKILGRSDFDQIVALSSHRQVLEKSLKRTRELIQTIDKTIKHLKGNRKMKEQEVFGGFDQAKQKEYEQQLINRFGDKVKVSFAECKRNVKHWTQKDWDNTGDAFKVIGKKLAQLIEQKAKVDSKEVQDVIRMHFKWLKQFWTPTKESYPAHGLLIVETDLRKPYEAFHKDLPEFLAKGIQIFAENELK
ncbi:MAG: MerR family transcriptional regulator [Simkaniaceae bacterium]